MATIIRLKRIGKKKDPYFRIIVTDSRNKRDGRVIEEIGKYRPTENPSYISVDSDRAIYWLKVGAQVSNTVKKILELTGDYQKFQGKSGAKSTLEIADKSVDIAAKVAAINDEAEKSKHEASQKRAEIEKKLAEESAEKQETAEAPANAEAPAEEAAAPAEEKAEAPVEEKTEEKTETSADAPAEEKPAEGEVDNKKEGE
jgi:small subunit ribosomal protein S16